MGDRRRRRSPGRIAVGALGGVALLRSATASADPTTRRSIFADTRWVTGVDDVAGLHLWHGGVGLAWALAPTLSLRAQALAMGSEGTSPRGSAAPFGAGGELALRLIPFPRGRVRPFALWSAGLCFFPSAAFLPGGDRYAAMIALGLGAEVVLNDRWTISLDGRYVHLSNGQGLGPHNPAFDGYGLALTGRYVLRPPEASVSPWASLPAPTRGRNLPTPGATLDLHVGRAGDGLLLAARVRVAQRIVPRLVAVLDASAGTLSAEPLTEAGLGLVGHFGPASVGAHVGHRRYAGVSMPTVVLQGQWHASDAVGFVVMGQWEGGFFDEDLWRAAVGVQAFPIPSLAIELGLAFDRIGRPAWGGDVSDPYLAVEWMLPLPTAAWQLSVFVDRQVDTVDTAGVRLSYGMGRTLRDLARAEGWRRLR